MGAFNRVSIGEMGVSSALVVVVCASLAVAAKAVELGVRG
jgi:hypothetical protein